MERTSHILEGKTIRIYKGASVDLPVFRSNASGLYGENPRYRFDTYGKIPSNFDRWNAKKIGMCGAFGYTDDVEVLVDSISEMNAAGLAAPICETLFDECKSMGATIVSGRGLK